MEMMARRRAHAAVFAPPFLKHGDLVIAQTANILAYLAPRLKLVPRDDASRARALELQLTIADLVAEAHDTHHPIGVDLYYEDQRPAAKKRAAGFVAARIPKYLGYFESRLAHSGGLLARRAALVRRPLGVPGRVRPVVRVPERHGARGQAHPAARGAPRSRRRATAHRRLPRVEAAHPVQRRRHLPALPGARREEAAPLGSRLNPRGASFKAPRPRRPVRAHRRVATGRPGARGRALDR